jgi:hypothetical protein
MKRLTPGSTWWLHCPTESAQHRERVIRRLRQRAANLGLALVNRETGELLEGAVS